MSAHWKVHLVKHKLFQIMIALHICSSLLILHESELSGSENEEQEKIWHSDRMQIRRSSICGWRLSMGGTAAHIWSRAAVHLISLCECEERYRC